MFGSNWWSRPAKPHEQGSFCDTTSEIHYDNVSKGEALEEQEAAIRRGDGVIEPSYEVEDYGSKVRFNTNITDTDNQGYDHPARFKPGK